MFTFHEEGWYFEDEDGFMFGPYETKELAQLRYAGYLEKRYAKPCEGDLVECEGQ